MTGLMQTWKQHANILKLNRLHKALTAVGFECDFATLVCSVVTRGGYVGVVSLQPPRAAERTDDPTEPFSRVQVAHNADTSLSQMARMREYLVESLNEITDTELTAGRATLVAAGLKHHG